LFSVVDLDSSARRAHESTRNNYKRIVLER